MVQFQALFKISDNSLNLLTGYRQDKPISALLTRDMAGPSELTWGTWRNSPTQGAKRESHVKTGNLDAPNQETGPMWFRTISYTKTISLRWSSSANCFNSSAVPKFGSILYKSCPI